MSRCARSDCAAGNAQRHHIVYEQELKRCWDWNQQTRERWSTWNALYRDPRNLFDLCPDHHYVGQHGGRDRIPVTDLPDEALEFAFELLGAYAYDYILRRYAGQDPRLESHLAAAS